MVRHSASFTVFGSISSPPVTAVADRSEEKASSFPLFRFPSSTVEVIGWLKSLWAAGRLLSTSFRRSVPLRFALLFDRTQVHIASLPFQLCLRSHYGLIFSAMQYRHPIYVVLVAGFLETKCLPHTRSLLNTSLDSVRLSDWSLFYFSLRSVVSSSLILLVGYHWRYSIKPNQFISVPSTSTAQNYAKNRFNITFSLWSLYWQHLSALTWRIATVVKAEVTWVKTKNCGHKTNKAPCPSGDLTSNILSFDTAKLWLL